MWLKHAYILFASYKQQYIFRCFFPFLLLLILVYNSNNCQLFIVENTMGMNVWPSMHIANQCQSFSKSNEVENNKQCQLEFLQQTLTIKVPTETATMLSGENLTEEQMGVK